MLGDWGAEVIKVEPREGDPQRGNPETAYFQLDNHGKRSVALDLKTEAGRTILMQMLDRADVFITNLRVAALDRLGVGPAAVQARNPRLVYGLISGYGLTGPAADKAGYDVGAFWSRAGVAAALVGPGAEPPVSRPGMGDHTTGLALVCGVLAALLDRERTGRGQLVSTSLLRAGAFVISSDLTAQMSGSLPRQGLRRAMYNPLLACYRAGDGRWFWLLGLQATRHWPNVLRAIDREDLLADERFRTFGGLIRHTSEVIHILDEAFATRTLDEWAPIFAREDVWWDPVQDLAAVLADDAFQDSGAVRPVAGGGRLVAPPVDLAGVTLEEAAPAPEAGEHTERVLLELGYDWPQITALKEQGVIP
jgi:crotonobetainyl-CoA:carnitine CoA-transferase CaiB-like acyl-CoA transferase